MFILTGITKKSWTFYHTVNASFVGGAIIGEMIKIQLF